ncbi:MAG: hypothetical protein J7513_10380 [Solirubrobacteraceae bacterium]|nr:hypothetical protein [Solirubrobacteraceae bacterium]
MGLLLMPARISVPRRMQLFGISSMLLPWCAPAYLALHGETDEGDTGLTIAAEVPIQWMTGFERFTKSDLEVLHVRRFNTDIALSHGFFQFGPLEPGGDPPDIVAATGSGPVGVEATVLTVPGRRGAHALFSAVRRRLGDFEPAHFIALRGHTVYVDFADAANALPFEGRDVAAADELLTELARFSPDPKDLVTSDHVPEQITVPTVGQTARGATFWAVPFLGAAPASLLFTQFGFELGLSHCSFVSVDDIWDEIERRIKDHDKPGVDLLLITASGPTRAGVIFPAEQAVAQLAVENVRVMRRRVEHIKEVVLHDWVSGTAWKIYPEFARLFGPLYQSLAPASHQITDVTQRPADDGDG